MQIFAWMDEISGNAKFWMTVVFVALYRGSVFFSATVSVSLPVLAKTALPVKSTSTMSSYIFFIGYLFTILA